MNLGSQVFLSGVLICMVSVPAVAQSSKDWVDIKNPKELRVLHSNKTLRGNTFVVHYRADGKGLLIFSNGERVPRTWEVKGDQVCVTDAKATNCFRLQRHKKNRNDIVAQNVQNGRAYLLTVEDGVPNF